MQLLDCLFITMQTKLVSRMRKIIFQKGCGGGGPLALIALPLDPPLETPHVRFYMYLFIQGHHVWAGSVSRRKLHWCLQCGRYTHHTDNITWNLQVSDEIFLLRKLLRRNYSGKCTA